MAWAGSDTIAECRVHNAKPSRPNNFLRLAGYSSRRELRLAVLSDEMAMATNSLASAMHLPCKQADVGALPTDSTSLRSQRRGSEAAAPEDRAEAGTTDGPVTLRLGKPISGR